MMENMNDSPVSAKDIASRTKRDPVLSRVYQFTQEGWPATCGDDLKLYEVRKSELTTQDGCVIWGNRVVIPPTAREAMLVELHAGHPGVSRMKALARSFVWWPGMDYDIEERVQQCSSCQLNQEAPAKAPLQPWSWPTRPWARVHINFAGPMEGGKMYLVVIDAHSKWLEVVSMGVCSALTTIQALRTLFAQFRIPETIVSDNGPQFVAREFDIQHVRVAPYHPASNGLAERAVCIFKEGLKKQTTGSLSDRIARLLFEYCRIPHTITGLSPAELMFGRLICSRLSLVRPSLEWKVIDKQSCQKSNYDKRTKYRDFKVGDEVLVKMHKKDARKVVKIEHKTGPYSFCVVLANGQVVCCHMIQWRSQTRAHPGLGPGVSIRKTFEHRTFVV